MCKRCCFKYLVQRISSVLTKSGLALLPQSKNSLRVDEKVSFTNEDKNNTKAKLKRPTKLFSRDEINSVSLISFIYIKD